MSQFQVSTLAPLSAIRKLQGLQMRNWFFGSPEGNPKVVQIPFRD